MTDKLTDKEVIETEKNVADVILERPTQLAVDIRPTNKIHALLQRWKWMPKRKIFSVQPAVAGTLIKISKLLLGIGLDPETFKDAKRFYQNGFKAMEAHTETIAEIIAIAIVNRKEDPPKGLIQFILYNFTSDDLHATLGIVLKQMDVLSFTSSIILIQPMNLLKMSPNDQGS